MAYLPYNCILKMHNPELDIQTQAQYPLRWIKASNTTNEIKNWNKSDIYDLNILQSSKPIYQNSIQILKKMQYGTYIQDGFLNSSSLIKNTMFLVETIILPVSISNSTNINTNLNILIDNNGAVILITNISSIDALSFSSNSILDRNGVIENLPINIGAPFINVNTSNIRYNILKHIFGFDNLYTIFRTLEIYDTSLNNIDYIIDNKIYYELQNFNTSINNLVSQTQYKTFDFNILHINNISLNPSIIYSIQYPLSRISFYVENTSQMRFIETLSV